MEEESIRDVKRELGLAAIKAIDEGLAELKKLLEGLEQEQKQEKERPRSEIEALLDLAEQPYKT